MSYTNPIPTHSALDDAGLSVYAFRIAGRIGRRWNERRGCDESVNNMADGCGMDRKTAYAAIKELTQRGIVVKTTRPGKPSRFDFAPVEEWSDLSRQTVHPRTATRDVPSDGLTRHTVQAPVPRHGTPPVPPDGTQRDPSKGSPKGIPFGVGDARAPEAGGGQKPRASGGPFDHPAVHAYADVTGSPPPMAHADDIARAFPNPDADTLRAFTSHVTTWHTTPNWNARNVPGLLTAFREHVARGESAPPASNPARKPKRPHSPDGSVVNRLAESVARSEQLLRSGAVGFAPDGGEGHPSR